MPNQPFHGVHRMHSAPSQLSRTWHHLVELAGQDPRKLSAAEELDEIRLYNKETRARQHGLLRKGRTEGAE